MRGASKIRAVNTIVFGRLCIRLQRLSPLSLIAPQYLRAVPPIRLPPQALSFFQRGDCFGRLGCLIAMSQPLEIDAGLEIVTSRCINDLGGMLEAIVRPHTLMSWVSRTLHRHLR